MFHTLLVREGKDWLFFKCAVNLNRSPDAIFFPVYLAAHVGLSRRKLGLTLVATCIALRFVASSPALHCMSSMGRFTQCICTVYRFENCKRDVMRLHCVFSCGCIFLQAIPLHFVPSLHLLLFGQQLQSMECSAEAESTMRTIT